MNVAALFEAANHFRYCVLQEENRHHCVGCVAAIEAIREYEMSKSAESTTSELLKASILALRWIERPLDFEGADMYSVIHQLRNAITNEESKL